MKREIVLTVEVDVDKIVSESEDKEDAFFYSKSLAYPSFQDFFLVISFSTFHLTP